MHHSPCGGDTAARVQQRTIEPVEAVARRLRDAANGWWR
jgi:hypothetical protein